MEPLQLADGRVIDTSTGVLLDDTRKFVEVPSYTDARNMVFETRKRIVDLPVPPKEMNAINVVLVYTMFGLDVDEISIATNLSAKQVKHIQATDAFNNMMRDVAAAIIEQDKEDVRNVFTKNAKLAANRIVNMINSDDEKVAYVAAKDVLDRDGHRPADVVEHRHKMTGGLHIIVEHKDANDDLPIIDVTQEN